MIRSSGKAVRLSGILLAAISVLAFSALSTGVASASSHSLVMEISGAPAANNSPAYIEIGLPGGSSCLIGTYHNDANNTELKINSAATDEITASPGTVEINPDGPCDGTTVTGSISGVTVKHNGKAKVSLHLSIAIAGCTYEVTKPLKATFTVPSSAAYTTVDIKGERSSSSSGTCAKTKTWDEAGLAIGGWKADNSPQDYELVSGM